MIILTSSVASVADHIQEHYLASKHFKSVLFIDTAAEPELIEDPDDSWLQADLASLQRQGYVVDRYTVTSKSSEEVRVALDAYDVIYMCGGNTKYLLEKLKESGAFQLIKNDVAKGKMYIGTSAGSIVAGPRLPDYFYDIDNTEAEEVRCFGFVDFTLVPHWGSVHFKEEYLGGRIEKVYKETQVPLLLSTDTQYVVVDDVGKLSIVNVR